MSLRVAASAIALAALAACVAAPTPLAPRQLEAIHLAAGRSAWAELQAADSAVLLAGEASFLGRTETFELLLAGDGRYRHTISGPLGQVEVFDGLRVVRRDASGIARELDLGDRVEAPLLASLLTGVWADGAGLELATTAPGQLVVARPGTPLEFELALDPATSLPARIVEVTSSGESLMRLDDWTPVAGALVPHSIHVTDSATDEPDMGESYRVTSTSVVALEPASFTLDTTLPADFHFDPFKSPALEARRAPTGHLLVHPLVDGHDVGWFILDSGAGAMVIAKSAAEELELAPLGEVRAVGVAGSEPTRFVQAQQFELGPLTLDAPVFVEIDFGFLGALFGVELGGVVGYDLFSRAVVELDHEAASLFDPRSYKPDPAWPSVELAFQGKTPCARACFPARGGAAEDWFRLDTGANGSLTFHAPAIERYGLLAQRETTLANFGGVGGNATGYFAELEWFELGGRRYAPFEAGFAMSNLGTFGDAYTAGNIGQDLFEGARLVFDYSTEHLYFAPSHHEAEHAPDKRVQ